jgi:hypothetical protein
VLRARHRIAQAVQTAVARVCAPGPHRRSRRVAIYTRIDPDDGPGRENASQILARYARLQGWTIVGWFTDRQNAAAGDRPGWQELMLLAGGSDRHLDVVLVWRLSDAFASLGDAVDQLQMLSDRDIDFRSHCDPEIDTIATSLDAVLRVARALARLSGDSSAPDATARNRRRNVGSLSADLQRSALRYLERQNVLLAAAEVQRFDQAGRRDAGDRVAHSVTYLLLLAGYSAVIALLSSQALIAALLLPSSLVVQVQDVGKRTTDLANSIPDLLQKLFVPLAASAALVLFRAVSSRRLAVLGGIGFGVLLSIALVGLASAAVTSISGLLAAVPGFVAATAILCEFGYALIVFGWWGGQRPASRAVTKPTTPGAARARWWSRVQARVSPRRSVRLAAIYIAIPIVCAATAVLVVQVGPVFHAGRFALGLVAVWAVWVGISMPSSMRAPVVSLVAMAAVITGVLTFGSLSIAYATGAYAVAVASICVSTLLWGASPATDRGGQD